jgi:SAM-dependent methyltransferase
MIPYKPHTNCRVCGSDKLTEYLDLGMMPLSNGLKDVKEAALFCERLPLKVLFCEECGLSQLSVVVDPEVMFGHYLYRSSINRPYVQHCREMAKYLKAKYKLNQSSFMIDIAGNDCALLKEFREEIGLTVLNIDPAKNLAQICVDKSIPTMSRFWGTDAAEALEQKVDLITATNVFAHVDNVNEFIESCKKVLSPDGILVIEFPYLIDFIENREFDTIYFEHLSYFSIHPLDILCDKNDLEIFHVEKIAIHGGSVRVEIGHKETLKKRDHTVSQTIREEREKYFHTGYYNIFAKDVQKSIAAFRNGVKGLSNVAGFAASAKGNTLLNCAGIKNELKYIVDETPEKKNKFSPGTGIKIVSMNRLKIDPPDHLVILSWNFSEEIINKCVEFGYKGKFIIPIPAFKILQRKVIYV